jgi:SsrA-binding protein
MAKEKSAGRQTQDNSKGKNKNKGKDRAKRQAGAEGRTISENRKARHRFLITEQLECGIVLLGSEVKSLREGRMSLDEAWVRVRDGELWLVSADIPEYRQATQWNHEPKRARKLLVRRDQLRKMVARAQEKGLTLVPLRVWFNPRGLVKVMVGVGRGKQLHDKREAIKERETRRQIDRAMRGKPAQRGR